jgi:peptidyl-tRNA hydrolase, PTH1 family
MTPDASWLVVGLGNPGPEYAHHRHNVGCRIADLLAGRIGVSIGRHHQAAALAAEGRLGLGGPRLILAKPLTYMNLAGGAVAGLANFYKVPVEQIVVVYDELDLPFATLRLKRGGGEGGHNGLRSISKSLGSRDYLRVRFGIGRPPGPQDPADFLLSNFTAAERKALDFLMDRAADAVEAAVTTGLERAQNTYHAT